MRNINFSGEALQELLSYKTGNQKVIIKILELVEDIQKSPYQGKGKPEPLKHNYAGLWSRRITDEHRLVYKITDNEIEVISCSGHY